MVFEGSRRLRTVSFFFLLSSFFFLLSLEFPKGPQTRGIQKTKRPGRKIPTRFLKTHAGIFRVTVEDMYKHAKNTRSNISIGKSIDIDCPNLCVSLLCPHESTVGNFTNIATSETHPEKQERLLRGTKAVILMNLAFTILKEEAPHIHTLEFEDTSTLCCEMDDKPYQISLALFELAFFQMTWYERWFGARLLTDSAQSAYLLSKEGFSKKQKPEQFSFQNKYLDELLTPLYEQTKSWAEFFKELYPINKKIKILLPWHKQALCSAMGGILYSGQQWKIELQGNEKIQRVEYKVVRGKKQYTNDKEDLSKIKYTKMELKKGIHEE
jgi:hypothetical protein